MERPPIYPVRVRKSASAAWLSFLLVLLLSSGHGLAQAPVGVVYVDKNFLGTPPGQDPDGAGPAAAFGTDSFVTIQEGVNAVAPGGAVLVRAGTFAENVRIDKSLSLLGPNAGIDPNTGVRNPETILVPSVTETSLQGSTSGTIIRVGNAGGYVDVTINGLMLDGHNPALTGGRTLNGVEIHTGAGIVNSMGSFDSNPGGFDARMTVQHCIIQNLERYGVLADNIPSRTPVSGTDVSYNKIDNLPSGNNFGGDRGRGVAFEENHYGFVRYNVMTRVNVGWQNDNYNLASPGSGSAVTNNEIHAYHRGIFHNLQYQDATAAVITDNQIFRETNGDFPASATNFGIELSTISSAVDVIVQNNSVTGNAFGIVLFNLTTTADITVSGGTLGSNQIGLYVTSNDPQFGAGAETRGSVSGVTITGTTAAGISIESAGATSTKLEIKAGTAVIGGSTGLQLTGPGAALVGGNLGNLAFVNQNTYIQLNGAMPGEEINGTNVLFDGLTGAAATLAQNHAIEDKIVHGVDQMGAGFVRVKAGNVFVTANSSGLVQPGVVAATANDTINVAAGNYLDDVAIDEPNLKLVGASPGLTTLKGRKGGGGSTIQVLASNAEITGFTITRDGNSVAEWNDPTLNVAGISIQGTAITGTVIHDNVLTGNRTGIDINNSNGHTIRNNIIDFNRVGMIFRNQTDNETVVENDITGNTANGILFLDASGGTNAPAQSAANCVFSNNNISDNWYAQIVDRQSGGSLPAPGNNPKNFHRNWFGTTTPVLTTANSTEPGYAAQIPVAYGGTATAPGGQPDIAGPASANFQFNPPLDNGGDSDVETTPGRGTFGFQGNNLPTLATIPDPAPILEDAPLSVNLTGIGAGPDETQTITVTAESGNPGLISTVGVTYTSPNPTGSVNFTPVPDQSGTAVITVSVSDGSASVSRTFTVEVIAVNDAPTLDAISNPTAILEDSGLQTMNLTGITAGPSESQTLTVTAVSNNPGLIPNPTVSYTSPNPTGSLTYTPIADQFGSTDITVTVFDGISEVTRKFMVAVTPVNDAPTIDTIADPAPIFEDAGEQTVNLTGISPFGGETQGLTITAASDNPGLIPDPTVNYTSPNGTGTLNYTPVADRTGTATITVTVQDDGGTSDDGGNTATRVFVVTVTAVNDAPIFTAGDNQSVGQDAGPQSIQWATAISAGPSNESTQALNFIVDTSDESLFDSLPEISPTGELTFTPRIDASGTATLTVRLHDNGGVDDGGIDTSDAQTFTIAVTTFIEEPGTYNGLIQAADGETPSHERSGLVRVLVKKNGTFTGKLKIGALSLSLKGSFAKDGVAYFNASGSSELVLAPNRVLSLQLDVGAGTDKLFGKVTDSGVPYAVIDADRALYSAARVLKPPFIAVPPDLVAKYTVVFAPKSPAVQGRLAEEFPQGYGIGLLRVTKKGIATISGTLADGTKFSYSNSLSKANRWPFYLRLAKGTGSVSGPVDFSETPNVSDLDGLDLHWFKPAGGTRYTLGWLSGINVDLVGSKFVHPPRSANQSILPSLPAVGAAGNAQVEITDGNVPAPGIVKAVNIQPNDKVQIITPAVDQLKVTLLPTGSVTGSFIHPVTKKKTRINGVIFQKQSLGFGFFVDPTEGGALVIRPN